MQGKLRLPGGAFGRACTTAGCADAQIPYPKGVNLDGPILTGKCKAHFEVPVPKKKVRR